MGEEEVGMDVWKDRIQQDISDLKRNQSQDGERITKAESDIHKLQVKEQLQDAEIATQKETLREIKDDTSWIRRKITGALITVVITAVVGGVIGIAIANIFGQG